jgi:glucose-6-phosphate isomerase
VAEFGIDPRNMLTFWDWVGGRYSVDSAIGFTLMVAIGRERFAEMLEGFHKIDENFLAAPLAENMPVVQGMLNIWYSNFFGAQSHVVLPYAERMRRFPAYLQQLTMESNGKSVRADGIPASCDTGEVFWGEPGTNGQHAFYQLLHQGTRLVPADFICFAESEHDIPVGDRLPGVQAEEAPSATISQHDLLVANCFAQSAALAFGRGPEELELRGVPPELIPHKSMPGDRPSSTILAPRLTPSVLGQLIALYEHIVFTEGSIWGIDSFDQWGVELGKEMASEMAPDLASPDAPSWKHDASTNRLIREYRQLRARPK